MLTRHLDNLKSGFCLQMAPSGRGDRMQRMGGYITEYLQTQRCRQESLYGLGESILWIKIKKEKMLG